MSEPLPTLRAYVLRTAAQSIATQVLEQVAASPEMFRSCLNCRYFSEPNAFCHGWNVHPPPRTIVYACASYVDRDDIPF